NGTAAQKIDANYGTFRPDVAQVFGRPDWTNSGFNVTWTAQGLSDGQHTFQVWAHSTLSGWNNGTVTLAAVTPPPTAASMQPVNVPPMGIGMPPQQPLVVQQPLIVPQPPQEIVVQQPPLVQPVAQPLPPTEPTVACGGSPTPNVPGMILLPC